jgi:hypothetical protein
MNSSPANFCKMWMCMIHPPCNLLAWFTSVVLLTAGGLDSPHAMWMEVPSVYHLFSMMYVWTFLAHVCPFWICVPVTWELAMTFYLFLVASMPTPFLLKRNLLLVLKFKYVSICSCTKVCLQICNPLSTVDEMQDFLLLHFRVTFYTSCITLVFHIVCFTKFVFVGFIVRYLSMQLPPSLNTRLAFTYLAVCSAVVHNAFCIVGSYT